jgi:hypothetical protein
VTDLRFQLRCLLRRRGSISSGFLGRQDLDEYEEIYDEFATE